MYRIIQKRKIWLTFSGIFVGLSVLALIIWGLNFGIDFTGGSLLEVKFTENRPAVTEVQGVLGDLDLGSLIVQPVGEDGMILKFQDISEEKHQEVLRRLDDMSNGTSVSAKATTDKQKSLEGRNGQENETEEEKENGLKIETEGEGEATIEVGGDNLDLITIGGKEELTNVEEMRFDSVGPSIGQELKQKSIYAIFFVLVAIVLYIAWVFRTVSKPVASWKFGITAIIALFHDVIITMGVFAVLGHFLNIEINTAFVAAILTVLGYSVNDTIVVFDRVRENLPKSEEDFEGTVNTSVNQTIRRSINTSVTTLLVLLSILFFGGSTIKDFILALSIGVFIGTYSSIFLASPVLVVWEKLKSRSA